MISLIVFVSTIIFLYLQRVPLSRKGGMYCMMIFVPMRMRVCASIRVTPVFRSVVLLILRMRLKELEMQIDLSACANLNRTTDLKTGVPRDSLRRASSAYYTLLSKNMKQPDDYKCTGRNSHY